MCKQRNRKKMRKRKKKRKRKTKRDRKRKRIKNNAIKKTCSTHKKNLWK